MVQQQEAEKAVFRMQQAKTDAESVRIQGEALEEGPEARRPKDGRQVKYVAPQMLGGEANVLLPRGARGGWTTIRARVSLGRGPRATVRTTAPGP
jgi:hypothetical protein